MEDVKDKGKSTVIGIKDKTWLRKKVGHDKYTGMITDQDEGL